MKYKMIAISILTTGLLPSVFGAGTDWWWSTSAPKNNNTTLSVKAGNAGSATKSITINSTSNSNSRFSPSGAMPYTVVQIGSPTMKRTRVVFTANGTWTPPSTVISAKVFMIGGGGGGQGGNASGPSYYGGNGGGAGIIIESNISLGWNNSGQYCNVTIGAGGAGGAVGGGSGAVGGDTSVECYWGGSSRVMKVAYGGSGGSTTYPGGGSANGGGGEIDTTSMQSTYIPAANWLCPNGAYMDSEVSGGSPAFLCKLNRGVEGSRSLFFADGSNRNVSGGGGGGYWGTSPHSTVSDSDSTTLIAPVHNTRPWGLGGKGYFGKGGDGGYGGSAFNSTSGASGSDTKTLPKYKPSEGWGAGGNGGAYFDGSGVQISSAGGGGGGFLGTPGVPKPPVQTITPGVGVSGTQGIVVFEY